jgi:hypothetical protein
LHPASPPPPRDPFYTVLAVVLIVAIVRLWILPLCNSFWLDDTLIAWIVRDGVGSVFSRAFHTPNSVAFSMLEALITQVLP